MKKILIILLLITSTAFAQGPCNSPNPPPGCNGGGGPCAGNNPPQWCNTNVPINNEIWMLVILGLGYAAYHYKFRK